MPQNYVASFSNGATAFNSNPSSFAASPAPNMPASYVSFGGVPNISASLNNNNNNNSLVMANPHQALTIPFNNSSAGFMSLPKAQREAAMLHLVSSPLQCTLHDDNVHFWGWIAKQKGLTTTEAITKELDAYLRLKNVSQDFGINTRDPQCGGRLAQIFRATVTSILYVWAISETPENLAKYGENGYENPVFELYNTVLRNVFALNYNIAQSQLPKGQSLDPEKFWNAISGNRSNAMDHLISSSTITASTGPKKQQQQQQRPGRPTFRTNFTLPPGCPQRRCAKCFIENGNKFDDAHVNWWDKCQKHNEKAGKGGATRKF